jgi:hypothetical protein
MCYVMQDFVILCLQYLYGKPFFLNDNYKEVKQKFGEEFGDKARFPHMMKKIRSGVVTTVPRRPAVSIRQRH